MSAANTTVVLMRHGHVTRNRNNLGQEIIYGPLTQLSEKGRSEIPRLAYQLNNIKLDKLYSSTTPRCNESTRLLVRSMIHKPLEVRFDHNLRSIHAPSWTGQPVEGAVDENGFYASAKMGDETHEQYSHRIWTTFQGILAENKGRTIGIMGHSEGIGLIMHKLHNPSDALPRIEEAIPTASAIKFEINPESFEIKNETSLPETNHMAIERYNRGRLK